MKYMLFRLLNLSYFCSLKISFVTLPNYILNCGIKKESLY